MYHIRSTNNTHITQYIICTILLTMISFNPQQTHFIILTNTHHSILYYTLHIMCISYPLWYIIYYLWCTQIPHSAPDLLLSEYVLYRTGGHRAPVRQYRLVQVTTRYIYIIIINIYHDHNEGLNSVGFIQSDQWKSSDTCIKHYQFLNALHVGFRIPPLTCYLQLIITVDINIQLTSKVKG